MESLYKAAKKSDWEVIDNFVKTGGDINTSLVLTGPKAGYTALHFAVIRKDETYVRKLTVVYQADVNSTGEDGAQPIHLACLLGTCRAAKDLLSAGANPDAELTEELYDKYAGHEEWSDEFGNKITLLTYAVINGDENLSRILLDYRANLEIKSVNNKTLLMCALENYDTSTAELLVRKMKNYPELLDARDDYGWHAVHYFLPSEKFEGFRYHVNLSMHNELDSVLESLIDVGADIDATIDGDPNTLLINMAAYRGCRRLVNLLLNRGVALSPKSRILRYATLPVNPQKFMRSARRIFMVEMERKNKTIIKFILEDMSFRREFGLFVPEEEIKLMDQLITEDENVKNIVDDYQEKIINGILKTKKFAQFGTQLMTIYDFMVKVFDDKTLMMLMKNIHFLEKFKELYGLLNRFRCQQIIMFSKIMLENFKRIAERMKLLEKVQKIENLRKAIPLPYELILMTIEYLDNKSLADFVKAFYQDPISIK